MSDRVLNEIISSTEIIFPVVKKEVAKPLDITPSIKSKKISEVDNKFF